MMTIWRAVLLDHLRSRFIHDRPTPCCPTPRLHLWPDVSRLAGSLSRFTFYVLRFTFYVSRFTVYPMYDTSHNTAHTEVEP